MPSPGAIRAAREFLQPLARADCMDRLAEIIDSETGLPELLAVAKEIASYNDGTAGRACDEATWHRLNADLHAAIAKAKS